MWPRPLSLVRKLFGWNRREPTPAADRVTISRRLLAAEVIVSVGALAGAGIASSAPPDGKGQKEHPNKQAPAASTELTAVSETGQEIRFRSASTASMPTAGTSFTLTRPASVVAGDILIAQVGVRGNPTITAPSSWALIRRDQNGNSFGSALYRHVAASGDPASWNWTFSSPQSAAGGISAYSGVSTSAPIAAEGGQANASSASITAPSITTPVADTLVVGYFSTAAATTITPPAGMAERYDVNEAGTYKLTDEASDYMQAVEGATGSRVATASPGQVNIGQLVALRPAGSTTAPPPPPSSSSSSSPPPPSSGSLWISSAELAALPSTGTAWTQMKAAADSAFPAPAVCAANMNHDMYTLAAALVYARLGDVFYRTKAANAINAAIGTEDASTCPAAIVGSRHQGVARNGAGYVIAADLIDLAGYSPTIDAAFRTWITTWTTRTYDSGLRNIDWMEDRANNVGFYAGATLAAAYAYLGNTAGLDHVHQVFKGAMGDRASWSAWSTNPSPSFLPDGQPFRPINPAGATKQGYNVDGYAVWEWGRCGSFAIPPCYTDYIWTDEGLLVQAEILENMGYGDVFAYESSALKRMIDAIHRQSVAGPTDFWRLALGQMNWQPFFVNYAYGTSYPTTATSQVGFQMGWAWQFEGRSR